jgi:hypothetical protein
MPSIPPGSDSTGLAANDESVWLAEVLATLKSRWLVIAGAGALFFLLALVYLWTATYNYTAALRVSSAQATAQRPGLGALGGLAAIAGIGGGAGEAATPFKLYIEGLQSREVADRLSKNPQIMHAIFAREWDAAAGRWREPASKRHAIKTGVFKLLGLPVYPWSPPGPAELQDFLAEQVIISQNIKTPLVTVLFNSSDPAFAVKFLTALHEADDNYLREQSRARTKSNIGYLAGKLETVSLAEYRKVLFDAIAEQEQQMMLVNNSTPFAAEPFGNPTVSLRPSSPRPIPVLISMTFAGLVAGTGLVLLFGWMGRRRAA